MQLGVCYYPEHWPEETWKLDAKRMKDLGLTWVRIGEFAWSRLEPNPGELHFDWLDRAVDTLGEAGLGVVLGTPTATPPKWLMDMHPDIYAVDVQGRRRDFGSRRHYSFNSPSYWRETKRIVTLLAKRYGQHEAVGAWQTDNEYGCHDTVRSYGEHDLQAFRRWLEQRYGSISALNEAWWNVFWSMEYRAFEEIELPNLTVTEANPSHLLDFYRFSSDAVVAYNRMQVDIIKAYSPERPVTHNAMLYFGDYDHFKLAQDLDIITWDNYPLGMLEQSALPDDIKTRYMRSGHPDLISFMHDLYRGTKRKAFWIMEQQPGQVNWAPSNPLPAPGMVRLWSHQAFAHGADVVAYFRWRAAVGAQELMHAGLNQHDGSPDRGAEEARRVYEEIEDVHMDLPEAKVALLFDYENLWATQLQPHAQDWNYWNLLGAYYAVLRGWGLDVDIVHPRSDLKMYQVVFAPALHLVDAALAQHLEAFVRDGGHLVVGPRSGAKTLSSRVHAPAPGPLAELMGVRIDHVDGLRPGATGTAEFQGNAYTYQIWADLLRPQGAEVLGTYTTDAYDGVTAVAQSTFGSGTCTTLGMWGSQELHQAVFRPILEAAGLALLELPDGVRVTRRGDRQYLMNFSQRDVTLADGLHAFGSAIGKYDVQVSVR